MKNTIQKKLSAPRSWSKAFTATITTVIIISSGVLLWTDTYSVAHPYNSKFVDEPNRNFLKVEYILAHPNQYDGFIFGSSRVGAILPSHVQGAKFYNMTYSEGIPHEHLLNLQLFLSRGIKIKKILLGLDEFSYQVSFAQHQQRWLTRTHPLAANSSWANFYRFYFIRLPTQHDKSQFKKKLFNPDRTMTFDIINQDQFYKKYLSESPNFKDNDPIYSHPTHYSGNILEATLQDIRDIVALCQQNNIELTIFINPIHHTTYEDTDKILLFKFQRELSNITSYYDFSGPNHITINNYNFVDTSHYTTDIGDFMLKNISDNNLSMYFRFKK